MTELGIQQAAGTAVVNPLPLSWLGRSDMPATLPAWANIDVLTITHLVNLQAQIGYTKSTWDYTLIGTNNEVGRYQFSTQLLESYGLLAEGSNEYYDTDCVNYKTCWNPVTIRKNTNSYANYLYNADSLSAFINSTTGQDHLAYQVIYDLYNEMSLNDAITSTDTPDIVAGMIVVGWELGAGAEPSSTNPNGTGAYAWRYFNIGDGASAFNSGRYAVAVLSQ